MSRITWFVVLNVLFSLAVATIGISGSMHGVHPLYLMLLFAICTTFIIDTRRWNDRNALLAVFSVIYFQFYGIIDFETLFGLHEAVPSPINGPVLSQTELIILIGGALVQVAYRVVCRSWNASQHTNPDDWPEAALLWVGLPLFAICAYLKWVAHVDLFITNDSATEAVVAARVGSAAMLAIEFGDTLQPLSILLLFYALSRHRRIALVPIAVAVILFQAVYGFVIDVKGEIMVGAIMLVVTKMLVEGRLPKALLGVFAASIVLLFPALQANRAVRGENNINHAQAARDIVQTFKDAYAARLQVTTGTERAQTLFERGSLKGSVEMIVHGTGRSVPFQHGSTLTPMLAAFIPKIIWPSKPALDVGRIVNRQFHVSEDTDSYVSPSHLGELYWNFGWGGVIAGMAGFGLLLGYLGARCDLSKAVTVTRILILAGTARLLILGFESSISNQYVVWARMMLAVAVLHFLFARPIASPERAQSAQGQEPSPGISRRFSNVMT